MLALRAFTDASGELCFSLALHCFEQRGQTGLFTQSRAEGCHASDIFRSWPPTPLFLLVVRMGTRIPLHLTDSCWRMVGFDCTHFFIADELQRRSKPLLVHIQPRVLTGQGAVLNEVPNEKRCFLFSHVTIAVYTAK